MAGSSTAEPPRFYFDLASPEAWLVAERSHAVLGVVPEWVPVRYEPPAFRCAEEVASLREDVERRASRAELLPVRWPAAFPPDSGLAMLVATYAKQAGRVVAFSFAAFRQVFAAGRDLGDPDTVMLAGAAAELHPRALLKGAELRGTAERLEAAMARAGRLHGPVIEVGTARFHGEAELAAAAAALRA